VSWQLTLRDVPAPLCVWLLQALDLNPSKGRHMLYSNLSAAYLQLGQQEQALAAAKASVELAPKGFHMVGPAGC
jgi:hypothetical protein